jgi:hypothetical protein
MYKSHIVEILKSFSKEELREFRNFVRSPFFNTSQSAVKLFEQLRLFYPEFNDTRLGKKIVYKDIFGKAEYNDGLLRVIISNLTKLAKEYLIFVNSRNNTFYQKLFLLNELNVRKIEKLFPIARKDAENFIKTLPKTDMMYYLNKSFLDDNIYLFNQWDRRRSNKKTSLSDDESLKNIMGGITRHYLIASLLMIRKLIVINKPGKIELNLPFTENILEVLESRIEEFSDTPIIKLHLNEILLLTKGGRKYFQFLKEDLLNKSEQYDIIINYSLHTILQRYAYIQTLKGKHSYNKEKLLLYKVAIKKNILKNPYVKYFDPSTFLSVINAAVDFNELSWTDKFINEYQKYLDPRLKDDLISISHSYILFIGKEYEKALELLNKIKAKKVDLLINVKILLLKIYYELDMFIEAYMVLDTLRHLLPKAETIYFSPVVYQGHKNFSKYYSDLIKAQEKNQSDKIFKILKELKKEFTIVERSWLLDKAKKSI